MNQMFVNNIYSNDDCHGDCNGYECLASIDNYSSLCKKISIGENVMSNEFTMIFPHSVGESKWRLAFYPQGQYVGEKAGDSIGIYLIMLSCEIECKTLKANVQFQLESQSDIRGPVKKVDTIFNFSIPSKRWIGEPEFVRKNWLNSKRRAGMRCNDRLDIRFVVEETEPEEIKADKSLLLKGPVRVEFTNAEEIEAEPTLPLMDPLEQKFTTAGVAVDKSHVNPIEQQNGHGSSDDRYGENNNDGDWSVVGGRRGNNNNKQNKNLRNTRSNTVLPEPKNKSQGKRKNQSKKGGRKKK